MRFAAAMLVCVSWLPPAPGSTERMPLHAGPPSRSTAILWGSQPVLRLRGCGGSGEEGIQDVLVLHERHVQELDAEREPDSFTMRYGDPGGLDRVTHEVNREGKIVRLSSAARRAERASAKLQGASSGESSEGASGASSEGFEARAGKRSRPDEDDEDSSSGRAVTSDDNGARERGRAAKVPLKEWVDDVPPLEGYQEDDDTDFNPSGDDEDETDLLSDTLSEALEVRQSSSSESASGDGHEGARAEGAERTDEPEQEEQKKHVMPSPVRTLWGSRGAANTFIPSEAYQGRKEGYVFREGLQGVGYYMDDAALIYNSTCAMANSVNAELGTDRAGQGAPQAVRIEPEEIGDSFEADERFGGGDEKGEDFIWDSADESKEYDEDGNEVNATAWMKMILKATGQRDPEDPGEDQAEATGDDSDEEEAYSLEKEAGSQGEYDGSTMHLPPDLFTDTMLRYIPDPEQKTEVIDFSDDSSTESTSEARLEWYSPEELAVMHNQEVPEEYEDWPDCETVWNASQIVAQTKRETCPCWSMRYACMTCQGIPRAQISLKPQLATIPEVTREEWKTLVPEDEDRTEWPVEEGEQVPPEDWKWYQDYPQPRDLDPPGLGNKRAKTKS